MEEQKQENQQQKKEILYGLPDNYRKWDQNDPNKERDDDIGNLTNYETKLIKALRTYPDRAVYHMKSFINNNYGYGKTHENLIFLNRCVLQFLAEIKASYWVEWGNLIGYVRHRGVSPWDSDMDVGILEENYEHVLSNLPKIREINDRLDFKYEKYEGDQEGYDIDGCWVIYLKEDYSVWCDLVKYRVEPKEDGGKRIRYFNTQCEMIGDKFIYHQYDYDRIMPQRKMMIFGQPALVPNKTDMILEKQQDIVGQHPVDIVKTGGNKVKWLQYDPVPFLIFQLTNPKLAHLLCQYPLFDIVEENDLKGFDHPLPYIIRQQQQKEKDLKTVFNGKKQTNQIIQKSSETDFYLNEESHFIQVKSGQAALVFLDVQYADLIKDKLDWKMEKLLYFQEHALWGKFLQVFITNDDILYIPKQMYVRRQNYAEAFDYIVINQDQ